MPAERLYLQDSRTLQFEATVTDIREFARRDGVTVWQIALDRTAFYPTGGGQPYDTGALRARSRSGAELLVQVDEVIEDEAGEVWHATTKPVLAGTAVRCELDELRRLDHMQQHTGQHLLSAVLADRFGLPTVGFRLGEQDTTIDLALPASETAPVDLLEPLREAELIVNRLIQSNLPVRLREVSGEEAQAMLAAGALRKLPPRSGTIRLVEIEGLDLNACGGTHVGSLGEIGLVLLRETERVKQSLRLHFLCGMRAVRAAREDWTTLSEASALLTTSRSGVMPAVQRIQAECRALGKERQKLREEIAENHAVQLAVAERIEDGIRLVYRSFANRDVEYIKLLADKLLAAVPQTVAILASTAADPATLIVACNFVSSDTPEASPLREGCDKLLRNTLQPFGLRGGGTNELAQASVPADKLSEVAELLAQSLGRHIHTAQT